MIGHRLVTAAARWRRRTTPEPQPDAAERVGESVRVLLRDDTRLAEQVAAARAATEQARRLVDPEPQPPPDLSPFNAVIGDVADRRLAPIEPPATAPALSPRAKAPAAPKRYGHASPWDLCWARLTSEERARNSHECAHSECRQRLALAVRLCPDHRHRKEPRRA